VALEQQPGFFFGHPKRRCPGAKRRECDERAAREVSSARWRHTSPQKSFR
jgi:hypothetical protein